MENESKYTKRNNQVFRILCCFIFFFFFLFLFLFFVFIRYKIKSHKLFYRFYYPVHWIPIFLSCVFSLCELLFIEFSSFQNVVRERIHQGILSYSYFLVCSLTLMSIWACAYICSVSVSVCVVYVLHGFIMKNERGKNRRIKKKQQQREATTHKTRKKKKNTATATLTFVAKRNLWKR